MNPNEVERNKYLTHSFDLNQNCLIQIKEQCFGVMELKL